MERHKENLGQRGKLAAWPDQTGDNLLRHGCGSRAPRRQEKSVLSWSSVTAEDVKVKLAGQVAPHDEKAAAIAGRGRRCMSCCGRAVPASGRETDAGRVKRRSAWDYSSVLSNATEKNIAEKTRNNCRRLFAVNRKGSERQ